MSPTHKQMRSHEPGGWMPYPLGHRTHEAKLDTEKLTDMILPQEKIKVFYVVFNYDSISVVGASLQTTKLGH